MVDWIEQFGLVVTLATLDSSVICRERTEIPIVYCKMFFCARG